MRLETARTMASGRTEWTGWTDPDAVRANAAGQMTTEQRASIAGPPVWPPFHAWAALALPVAGVGWYGVVRVTHDGFRDGGMEILNALVLMVLAGWWYWILVYKLGKRRWKARRRRRHRIKALAAPRIESALGQVVAKPDGELWARVGSSMIAVPEGSAELPTPAWYRLYWLESTKVGPGPLLLSAQPVDREEAIASVGLMAVETARVKSRLEEAMGFTASDLASNQAGQLTPRQRRFLVRHSLSGMDEDTWLGALVFLVFGVLQLVLHTNLWIEALGQPDDMQRIIYCLLLVVFSIPVLLLALLACWMAMTTSRLALTVRALRAALPVRRTVGEVTVGDVWHRRKGTLSHEDMTFTIPTTEAQVFLQPSRYVLYHLPALETLLSAEPVSPEDSLRTQPDHPAAPPRC